MASAAVEMLVIGDASDPEDSHSVNLAFEEGLYSDQSSDDGRSGTPQSPSRKDNPRFKTES